MVVSKIENKYPPAHTPIPESREESVQSTETLLANPPQPPQGSNKESLLDSANIMEVTPVPNIRINGEDRERYRELIREFNMCDSTYKLSEKGYRSSDSEFKDASRMELYTDYGDPSDEAEDGTP